MDSEFWSGFVTTTAELVEGNWPFFQLLLAVGISFFAITGFVYALTKITKKL